MNNLFGKENIEILSDDEYYGLHKSHRFFGLRARQELKRAERYCEFISFVIIDIRKSNNRVNFNNKGVIESGNSDLSFRGLENLICKTVRSTDYVSSLENGRIGLLLVETPEQGAESLLNRLKTTVAGYLESFSSCIREWEASYSLVSFPSDIYSKQEFLGIINEFLITT